MKIKCDGSLSMHREVRQSGIAKMAIVLRLADVFPPGHRTLY